MKGAIWLIFSLIIISIAVALSSYGLYILNFEFFYVVLSIVTVFFLAVSLWCVYLNYKDQETMLKKCDLEAADDNLADINSFSSMPAVVRLNDEFQNAARIAASTSLNDPFLYGFKLFIANFVHVPVHPQSSIGSRLLSQLKEKMSSFEFEQVARLESEDWTAALLSSLSSKVKKQIQTNPELMKQGELANFLSYTVIGARDIQQEGDCCC